MRPKLRLLTLVLVLALSLPVPAQAGSGSTASDDSAGGPERVMAPESSEPAAQIALLSNQDRDLAREHQRFAQFAREQVEHMNANIIGGRSSVQVRRDPDGLYRASYRAINLQGIVCEVRRAESDPQFFVGNLIYREQVLESVGSSDEACRQGPYVPVGEKANRLIYTSNRGGGWQR